MWDHQTAVGNRDSPDPIRPGKGGFVQTCQQMVCVHCVVFLPSYLLHSVVWNQENILYRQSKYIRRDERGEQETYSKLVIREMSISTDQ